MFHYPTLRKLSNKIFRYGLAKFGPDQVGSVKIRDFGHATIMKVVALYTNRSIVDCHDISQSGGGATVKFTFLEILAKAPRVPPWRGGIWTTSAFYTALMNIVDGC